MEVTINGKKFFSDSHVNLVLAQRNYYKEQVEKLATRLAEIKGEIRKTNNDNVVKDATIARLNDIIKKESQNKNFKIGDLVYPRDNSYAQTIGHLEYTASLAGTAWSAPKAVKVASTPFAMEVATYGGKKTKEFVVVEYEDKKHIVLNSFDSASDGRSEVKPLYPHYLTIPITMDNTTEMTYGQQAVGYSFNPSNLPEVDTIKIKSATLIDEIDEQRTAEQTKTNPNGEKIAMMTLAIRRIQEGQMWGVKAATWKS